MYTDLKLFILRNAPLTVGMDESDGQWDDQILDLLQAAGAPLDLGLGQAGQRIQRT